MVGGKIERSGNGWVASADIYAKARQTYLAFSKRRKKTKKVVEKAKKALLQYEAEPEATRGLVDEAARGQEIERKVLIG